MYRTYLAGSIEAHPDGGIQWRERITPKLEALGILVQDPCQMETDKTGLSHVEKTKKLNGWVACGAWDKFYECMDQIWFGTPKTRGDIECVRFSDFIVVYLEKDIPTSGTRFEMAVAALQGVPIYLVYYGSKAELNNSDIFFTLKSGGHICQNFSQLIAFVEKTYPRLQEGCDDV